MTNTAIILMLLATLLTSGCIESSNGGTNGGGVPTQERDPPNNPPPPVTPDDPRWTVPISVNELAVYQDRSPLVGRLLSEQPMVDVFVASVDMLDGDVIQISGSVGLTNENKGDFRFGPVCFPSVDGNRVGPFAGRWQIRSAREDGGAKHASLPFVGTFAAKQDGEHIVAIECRTVSTGDSDGEDLRVDDGRYTWLMIHHWMQ